MSATMVVQLSDSHLLAQGAERHLGRDPARRLQEVIGAVTARVDRPVSLVLITGDITDDGSEQAANVARELVAPLGARVLAVAGNHDTGPEIRAVFDGPRHVEVGAWTVIGLETRVDGAAEGALDVPGALAKIDADTERPTVLAMHHPPLGPSTHPWFQLAGAESLLSALTDRPHVRLILSGHLHQSFEYRHGALGLLGAPSTLYGIRHEGDTWTLDDAVPTGARLVHLADDGSWSSELVTA